MTGCLSSSDGDCTLAGGLDGISVAVPQALAPRAGSMTIEVCQDGRCVTERRQMRQLTGSSDVDAGGWVEVDGFAQRYDEGPSTVTVELIGRDGRVVARREQQVELDRYYPNGKACDGDGFVSGSIALTDADRVVQPTGARPATS